MFNKQSISLQIESSYIKKYGRQLKKVMPLAIIFYFFNSFLLPPGLLFTTLLTPFYLFWLIRINAPLKGVFFIYFLIVFLFFLFHNFYDVYFSAYFISSTLYFTCLTFTIAIYYFLKRNPLIIESIFNRLVRLNATFVIIALLSLLVVPEKNIFWYKNEITEIIGNFPRLKLFTTEPSAYSMLLVPLFLFYFQFFFFLRMDKNKTIILMSLSVSLLISLSYGTIAGIIVSIFIFTIINVFKTSRKQFNLRLIVFFAFMIGVVIVLLLGPLNDSGIVLRVSNILAGKDTSANGRSFEAYILADKIISTKNSLIGLGPGQLKIIGKDIITNFYDYGASEFADSLGPVRIPSALADLLSVYGYLGLVLKLVCEIYLFVKTKVSESSYRLCLFIFMFLFQFVGSDTANVNEYFIWVLVFSGLFPDAYFKSKRTIKKSNYRAVNIYGK
ncbi:hypothetical protein [Pedobacter sp. MW01-1-1]|uniref:hypothetical protein n=1 Tax=Pedobacter sp. MW01-1-1 TaxID=3383027 RepID=UPI003FEF12E4